MINFKLSVGVYLTYKLDIKLKINPILIVKKEYNERLNRNQRTFNFQRGTGA